MNQLLELAKKFNVPYHEGDQDFYLLRASAERCLEFLELSLQLEFNDFQRGEVFGLVLASYERYLEEQESSTKVESGLIELLTRWGGNTWVAQVLDSEGWDDKGKLGPILKRLRGMLPELK